MNAFEKYIVKFIPKKALHSIKLENIQVNVGFKCNQECAHCHVDASPHRSEMMDWPVMELVIKKAEITRCPLIDITGGSPELNPYIKRFIKTLREKGHTVQVRTNLTVLQERGFESFPDFYRENEVHLVASMPCYMEENVRNQRGPGVYEKSIEVLRRLNSLGYGMEPDLPLNLVYNPGGAFLPPDQSALEADYRRELHQRFGIKFTNLLTITNMPIGRFLRDLRRNKRYGDYMRLLHEKFNPLTLDALMCRHQVTVGWDGILYDCDFNLALGLPVNHGLPYHIGDFDPAIHTERKIVTGEHCFGCVAGSGSSCRGALV